MGTDKIDPREEIAKSEAKVNKQAKELRGQTPKQHLPEIIGNLEQYIKLRTLYEVQYQELPEDLREEIGTRDPMDEFIDTVGDFEGWDDLSDAYGYNPPGSKEPQWSIDELKKLVAKLKQ